jgi:hypothetical protein
LEDADMPRNNKDFNGPQRAVDAMAEGRDPNEDRKLKGAEYGMKAPAKTVTPGEVYEGAKGWITNLFGQSKTEHYDKSPAETARKK